MPSINEFIGPKPTKDNITKLEKIVGSKPCSKCEMNSEEYFWDPIEFTMRWTCLSGHNNFIKVNS